ncbi:glutathione S-transferase family protein [Microvirga terricola]|uniref:Glutathione S-transferase family protein n=1 Tax=Microvirga terricola TaxID=2719797 RepID=A0ABX0VG37_9HYPH|nr:glutathione S-transferase family protein [Microvirga terricola]NIX76962.1 glutathione S-transferase family protein [Microvirga terricola]
MYQLFIANKNYSSWSLRPWVLMTELAIPFEEQMVLFGGASNWDRFRDFAPNGKVPCLKDGDTVVWDSLAIAEYLAERHPGVWPSDASARTWARSAAAEMHSGFTTLRGSCPMCCGIRVRIDEWTPALKHDIARIGELWSDGLNRFGGPFLAGKAFTAVDAFFAPVAFRAQTYGLTFGETADAYVKRLLALPAMKSWYEAALAETWREPAHEDDVKRTGTWLEDRRATA